MSNTRLHGPVWSTITRASATRVAGIYDNAASTLKNKPSFGLRNHGVNPNITGYRDYFSVNKGQLLPLSNRQLEIGEKS